MPPIVNIIALASFAASLSTRALDPVLPQIATDFGVSITTAAGFASAYAITYAITQPVLGAAADLFGKARLIMISLVLLGAVNLTGALTTSFSMLFVTRILAGIVAGGIFPSALSFVSDLVAPATRQVAIGRALAGSMAGNLLGASLSGVIGDLVGWRGVLAVLGALAIAASLAVALGFRGKVAARPPVTADFAVLREGYRTIFANPNAKFCFGAVLVEGCCVLGLFPYVASFLFDLGVRSLTVSGIVIAGFAIGGLLYTMTVSRLLPRLGIRGMMIGGSALLALQFAVIAFGPPWPVQVGNFILMGFGFYMMHGCLQVFASELTAEVRGTAMALHSFFFFVGQSLGPIFYGFGIFNAGKVPTMLAAAAIMLALGFTCARWLRQTRPADA
jgi:predicted MFS family arabinose efflux permease